MYWSWMELRWQLHYCVMSTNVLCALVLIVSWIIVSDVCFFRVEKMVLLFKHKLRPENAYFNEHNFDAILSAPKEELHQFLIGLYGDHLLPATKYEIEKVLRGPDTIKGFNKNKDPQYIISKTMLKGVWKRLRDRLASGDLKHQYNRNN